MARADIRNCTMQNTACRQIQNGDEEETFTIVKNGFHTCVQSDLTEEGTIEFFRAAREMIYERPENHVLFVAVLNTRIAGMINIRDNGHIGLFFVEKRHQGKGIGRKLLETAEAFLRSNHNIDLEIDVNSSLFAVKAYESLGFIKTKDIQTVNGIKFVPMLKKPGG